MDDSGFPVIHAQRAVAETTAKANIATLVSLDPLMIDGTGMCGGCRVKLSDGMKFACVDGPDFDGHAVDFDDLMARLQRYRPQEAAAIRAARASLSGSTAWAKARLARVYSWAQ